MSGASVTTAPSTNQEPRPARAGWCFCRTSPGRPGTAAARSTKALSSTRPALANRPPAAPPDASERGTQRPVMVSPAYIATRPCSDGPAPVGAAGDGATAAGGATPLDALSALLTGAEATLVPTGSDHDRRRPRKHQIR